MLNFEYSNVEWLTLTRNTKRWIEREAYKLGIDIKIYYIRDDGKRVESYWYRPESTLSHFDDITLIEHKHKFEDVLVELRYLFRLHRTFIK